MGDSLKIPIRMNFVFRVNLRVDCANIVVESEHIHFGVRLYSPVGEVECFVCKSRSLTVSEHAVLVGDSSVT